MGTRADAKQASLQRILDAGAQRIRSEGFAGAAIAKVMADAGLTHGSFYCHFSDKEALAAASLRQALVQNRLRWTGGGETSEPWPRRLSRLAQRYLTRSHRDVPEQGCALAAVATEVGRAAPHLKATFEQELLQSLAAIDDHATDISPDDPRRRDAIALMALCIGGLSLSRAVADPTLSDWILTICADHASTLATEAS